MAAEPLLSSRAKGRTRDTGHGTSRTENAFRKEISK